MALGVLHGQQLLLESYPSSHKHGSEKWDVSNSSCLSDKASFHFHDYGRKGKHRKCHVVHRFHQQYISPQLWLFKKKQLLHMEAHPVCPTHPSKIMTWQLMGSPKTVCLYRGEKYQVTHMVNVLFQLIWLGKHLFGRICLDSQKNAGRNQREKGRKSRDVFPLAKWIYCFTTILPMMRLGLDQKKGFTASVFNTPNQQQKFHQKNDSSFLGCPKF